MNKVFSILFFILIISIGLFQYIRNSEPSFNYERFNLVSPGVLRTPDKRFEDLQDYPFTPNYLINYYEKIINIFKFDYCDISYRPISFKF